MGNYLPKVPDVICEDQRLSTLCTSLNSLPDLKNKLSREDVSYSIFAPTNEAFASLIEDKGIDASENSEMLESLILFHTIVDFNPIDVEELICGNFFYMANGQLSQTICDPSDTTSIDNSTIVYQKGEGNDSGNMPMIIDPNFRAKNGVVHIVDNVMLQLVTQNISSVHL